MIKALQVFFVALFLFSITPAQAKEGDQLPLLYAPPYVIVYGPKKCPPTKNFVTAMKKMGLNHVFKDVNGEGRAEFEKRMTLSRIKRYGFPMVDVNGHLLSKPTPEVVRQWYAAGIPRAAE